MTTPQTKQFLVTKDQFGDLVNETELVPGSPLDVRLSAAFVTGVRLTGTPATDTAAIQAAIDLGGRILLQGVGTYTVNPLLIKTGAHLDLGGVTLKLANAANADLISVPNFGTLTGGNTSGGESGWAISNGVLDGNGANQTGTSWPLRVYAFNYRVDNVEMINGLSGNAYSEWGNNAGGNMEAVWTKFKLREPVGDTAIGLDWHGPHDSIFTAGEVVAAPNAITMHQTGIWTRGNAGGEVFTGVHVWGLHQNGWILDHSADCSGCEAEGAYVANVLLRSSGVRFAGRIFGTSGLNPTEVGVQFGDGTIGNIKRALVDADFFNFNAGAFAVNFFSDGGFNRVRGTGVLGTATAFYTGTRSPNTEFDILGQDGTTDQSTHQHPHPLTIRSSSAAAINAGAFNWNAGSSILDFNGTTQIRGYKDNHATQTFRIETGTGAIFPGTAAGVASGGIYSGSGAPTENRAAGAIYIRTDTPTVANQRIYQNTANGVNWVPIDDAPAESLFIPAQDMLTASGSPTLTAAPGATAWPRWLLDSASTEIVVAVLPAPKGWATANVFLWWSNESSGTGVSRFQVRAFTDRGDAGSMTSSEIVHGTLDGTAPAQGVLARSQVGAALTVSAAPTTLPRPLMNLSVRRLGADVNDTLGNDAALLGVELVRVS